MTSEAEVPVGTRRGAAVAVWTVASAALLVLAYLTGIIVFVALLAPVGVPVVVGLVRRARGKQASEAKPLASPRAAALMAGVAGTLWIAAGAYLIAWQLLNEKPPFRNVEFLGGISFGLAYALPGFLVALAYKRRGLLVAAAACGFVLTVVSFTLAPIFLILTLLIVWAHSRIGVSGSRPAIAALASVLFLGAGWWFQLSGSDPLCYSYTTDASGRTTYAVWTPEPGSSSSNSGSALGEAPPGGEIVSRGSGCTSDITTPGEGAASIAIVGLIPAAAWFAAGTDGRRAAGS